MEKKADTALQYHRSCQVKRKSYPAVIECIRGLMNPEFTFHIYIYIGNWTRIYNQNILRWLKLIIWEAGKENISKIGFNWCERWLDSKPSQYRVLTMIDGILKTNNVDCLFLHWKYVCFQVSCPAHCLLWDLLRSRSQVWGTEARHLAPSYSFRSSDFYLFDSKSLNQWIMLSLL